MGEFLCRLFDLWYADLSHGDYVYIRYFENLAAMLLGRPPESCGMSGQCACGFTVEADGSVYPCDFYVLDPLPVGAYWGAELCRDGRGGGRPGPLWSPHGWWMKSAEAAAGARSAGAAAAGTASPPWTASCNATISARPLSASSAMRRPGCARPPSGFRPDCREAGAADGLRGTLKNISGRRYEKAGGALTISAYRPVYCC